MRNRIFKTISSLFRINILIFIWDFFGSLQEFLKNSFEK